MSSRYTYIWEYVVDPARVDDFLAAYGPNGQWVALFREHEGYVRTELHRDKENTHRFITIDYWESRSAWQSFRDIASDDFERLDARCDEYTVSEQIIGEFALVE